MPSIIDLIRADHRHVESLFERFAAASEGAVASSIFRELSAHAEAEEHVLYPAAVGLGDGKDGVDPAEVDRSYDDHAELKALITRAMQSEGAGLVQLMSLIEAAVTEHVAREEAELLPRLEQRLSPDVLLVLGAQLQGLKQRVG